MQMTKLTITSDLAHFKNGINGKNQNTYKTPPISTVIGILKNIYNENINNFIFGYTCVYDGLFKDVNTIYKEISYTSKSKSKRFQSDICFIEYLVNPRITIYTDIREKTKMNETLNLGKTSCLAKCSFSSEEIITQPSIGYNQWTTINTGGGIIQRINSETKYNPKKGYYDYKTKQVRFNTEFDSKCCTESNEQGLFLWKYIQDGEVECY